MTLLLCQSYLVIHFPLVSIFEEHAVLVIVLPPGAAGAPVGPEVVLEGHAVAPGPGALRVSVRAAHPGLGVLAPGVEDELVHLPGVDTGQVTSCTLAPRCAQCYKEIKLMSCQHTSASRHATH